MKENGKRYRVVLHILVFLAVLIPPVNLLSNFGLDSNIILKVTNLFISVIPLCIFNLVFLIPKYLKKQKYWQYISGYTLLAFFYYIIISLVDPFESHNLIVSFGSLEASDAPMKSILRPSFMPFMPMLLIATMLGTTLETILDWEKRGKVIERKEKERLAAELSFLKSQINPHFFFNTLNGIYALAASDTKSTQRAILLLSSLMRYILYDSNVEKVPLSKEVQFLNDFIDLHKLRYTKSDRERIEFKYLGNINEYKIEPLLLVPFVENAFKYSFSYKNQSEVLVSIEVIENERLIFKVSNSIGEHTTQIKNGTGIGLENIKKRLSIVYPKQHELVLDKTEEYFNVTLMIE